MITIKWAVVWLFTSISMDGGEITVDERIHGYLHETKAECEYVAEETVAYMQKKGSIEGRSVELRCLKVVIN